MRNKEQLLETKVMIDKAFFWNLSKKSVKEFEEKIMQSWKKIKDDKVMADKRKRDTQKVKIKVPTKVNKKLARWKLSNIPENFSKPKLSIF